jgi:hypothetical protein
MSTPDVSLDAAYLNCRRRDGSRRCRYTRKGESVGSDVERE